MQGKTADFTSYGVEGADHDSLRSVINYNFDSCGSLQGTDVTALTTNDTSLYLVILNMEHGNTVLNSRFRCHTLYRLDDNALSLLVGSHLGIIHNLIDIGSGTGLGLILEGFNQAFTGLIHAKTGNFLKFGPFLLQQTAHTLFNLSSFF